MVKLINGKYDGKEIDDGIKAVAIEIITKEEIDDTVIFARHKYVREGKHYIYKKWNTRQ